MRYILLMAFFAFFGSPTFSQNLEIGPYIGGANFVGDVGNSTYIRPSDLVFGGIIKWNRSVRHSWRLTVLHTNLQGIDQESGDRRRQARGYSFINNLTEASLGMEFTFWEYDPTSPVFQSTPYLYSGISYYRADHFMLNALPTNPDAQLEEAGTNWGFAIPMTIGFKQTFGNVITGAVEIGARYTFSDNLDGSHPSVIEGNFRPYDFGNTNTTDWYVFTGIYITLNFSGKVPCYDTF